MTIKEAYSKGIKKGNIELFGRAKGFINIVDKGECVYEVDLGDIKVDVSGEHSVESNIKPAAPSPKVSGKKNAGTVRDKVQKGK